MIYSASFSCYKVSLKLNLQLVAAFFKIPHSDVDPDCLVFNPKQVGAVLKFETPTKFVWLFKFGCICFANFDSSETYHFLKHLEFAYDTINFNLFSQYNENYNLELDDTSEPVVLWKILGIYALTLAKSIELQYLQAKLDLVYDRAERLIFDLQRGFPKPTSRSLKKMTIEIVKIQLALLNKLKVLERPKDFDDLELKNIHNSAINTFELLKRFETIQTKIITIIEIITPYQKLGFNRQEKRLLIFETVLLALFPLPRVLNYFFSKILTFLRIL